MKHAILLLRKTESIPRLYARLLLLVFICFAASCDNRRNELSSDPVSRETAETTVQPLTSEPAEEVPASTKSVDPWSPRDLGTQLWLDWWAEDLEEGPVSVWSSRGGEVEARQKGTNPPVKQDGAVMFPAGGTAPLVFPRLGDFTSGSAPYPDNHFAPHINHRAVAVLFRIDLPESGSGSLFTVNGYKNGWRQQPGIMYDGQSITVKWRTPGSANEVRFPVKENDAGKWHVLVARRDMKHTYASLDGKDADGNYGETVIEMADWAVPRTNVPVESYIGDFNKDNPEMAIDTVLILQDDVSRDTAERLSGWALWRRDAQDQLPEGHPYRSRHPESVEPEPFLETTPEEWKEITDFWGDRSRARAGAGTPVDLEGWELVFDDGFETSTVTHDVKGRGDWFGPTHPDGVGDALVVYPGVTEDPAVGGPGNPETYIQNNGSLTIRMQQTKNGRWRSGSMATVNSNGFGRAWKYPYVEARIRVPESTTGATMGAWPAIWMKSLNTFTDWTETNVEYDIYEGFGDYINKKLGYVATHVSSMHHWPANRTLPDRLQKHRYKSNHFTLNDERWHENVNLFDGEFHTYGTMITPEWVINYFDGREMHRFPTPVEMTREMWVLLSLHLKGKHKDGASGIYEMEIDHVRVYQNPAYRDL